MRLRIATSSVLPEPDQDEAVFSAALRRAGIDAELCAWDSPSADWERPIPTVIRSTWNYHRRPAAFLDWCERAARAAPLWNEPAIIRWNAHKRYLLELQGWGIDVVPTELVERTRPRTLDSVLAERGWARFVIKPAVSAGSFGTRVFGPDALEAARAHLAELSKTEDALVQPYLSSVEGYGERCLVWIDGEFTHAIRKAPRFANHDESVTGPMAIDAAELRVAHQALESSRSTSSGALAGLLYGRVDLIRDESGAPLVAEMELIEPSLFLMQSARACDRLVSAIARRLRTASD